MRPLRLAPTLAVAITLGVFLPPAAAGAQGATPPPPPTAAAEISPWDAHPSGRYHLTVALPEAEFEALVTIADSSGAPVATLRLAGNDAAYAATVKVMGTDLLLHLDNPKGTMDFVLQHHGDKVTGAWKADEVKGVVTGTIEH